MKTFRPLFILLLTSLMALGTPARLSAQTPTTPTGDELRQMLPGLWQCTVDGKYSFHFKTIGRKGRWANFWLLPQNGQAIYTMKGAYRIDDDGLYVETIKESVVKHDVGKSTLISIIVYSNDHIKLSYQWNGKQAVEEWRRVIVPDLEQSEEGKRP